MLCIILCAESLHRGLQRFIFYILHSVTKMTGGGGGEGVRNEDVCAEGNEHNCDIYVPFYIKINFS